MTTSRALLREVNERIRDLSAVQPSPSDRIAAMCECGGGQCHTRIAIPWQVYEDVRATGQHFVVAPGHEQPEQDRVLVSDDGYRIVTV